MMQIFLETASWARVMRHANDAGTRHLGIWKAGMLVLELVFNQ